MNDAINKLSPTLLEKKILRLKKIRAGDLHLYSVKEIQSLLGASRIRAMELFALSEFQSLPSIGVRFAHDLISLGYYSLNELKKKHPAKLIHQLEKQIGAWADPCLEDQFRLAIYYANHRDSRKNWWDFTNERKAYRLKHGYPRDRPTRPWYELDQYKTANRVLAKSTRVNEDILKKVHAAMTYLKKNFTEKISLHELSKIACISPFHFQRSFKAAYDQSPGQFATHLRLKKACRMLKQTRLPVNDIVIKCGFENPSSFNRLFKNKFQETPIDYRENFREKIN
jgi:AraC-like DNA-binding protein